MDLKLFDEFPNKDNNVYIYLRVSTDKQSIEGQLKEVYDYCLKNRVYPPSKNVYIDENISGKINWKERKLNDIVIQCKKGDTIIVPELSRLGRNMMEIQGLLHDLVNERKITIIDIKNNLKLDGTFQSSLMAMLFSMASQMERQLTSERTRKGMQTDKCKLAMKNRKPKFKNKLDGKEEEIKNMIIEGKTKPEISKILCIHNAQLHKFIKDKNISSEKEV
jgi:DNA invertase Pin-like site-specific DNA recombinase